MQINQQKFIDQVHGLIRAHGLEPAMRLYPGGEFDAIGLLEKALLVQHGLAKDSYLIDVGCGSGRLALPLSNYLEGQYLGLDVVPKLISYTRKLVKRRNFRFEITPGLKIPETDRQADMVCFFSVFTHLPHEQSYLYLKEARRVLKPTGKIVFSFLEFAVEDHWVIFENTARNVGGSHPPDVFLSRDAIQAWARHLNLNIEMLAASSERYIQISEPVVFENRPRAEVMASLGQSVCVMTPAD